MEEEEEGNGVDLVYELPAWCSRPFCRSNTQSEPEDYCHNTEHSSEEEEELVECQKDCCDYYYSYCGKKNSLDLTVSTIGNNVNSMIEEVITDDEMTSEGEMTMLMRGMKMGDDKIKYNSSDSEKEDGKNHSNTVTELKEGFALVFFVVLPMMARQIGSIISRRLLGRLFGRYST